MMHVGKEITSQRLGARVLHDAVHRLRVHSPSMSTLKPSREQIKHLVSVYAKNRSTIQRCLLVGFVVHVLRSTLAGFASGQSASARKGRVAIKSKEAGKPPRVAVSLLTAGVACYVVSEASQVDAVFHQRLTAILRIVIPSLRSKGPSLPQPCRSGI
jgi:ATP-binding cassette, subfamily D (ALD), peroxisomal long-chain fatty acid import protein